MRGARRHPRDVGGYWDFFGLPSSPYARFQFIAPETPRQFAIGIMIAALIAWLMSYEACTLAASFSE